MEFIETIRKLCPRIPVIMLTTHATAEDCIKALGIGVWELINTPTNDAEEIICIIKVIAKPISKTLIVKRNEYGGLTSGTIYLIAPKTRSVRYGI
jgi:DNA-binding NtrC family response regulator